MYFMRGGAENSTRGGNISSEGEEIFPAPVSTRPTNLGGLVVMDPPANIES